MRFLLILILSIVFIAASDLLDLSDSDNAGDTLDMTTLRTVLPATLPISIREDKIICIVHNTLCHTLPFTLDMETNIRSIAIRARVSSAGYYYLFLSDLKLTPNENILYLKYIIMRRNTDRYSLFCKDLLYSDGPYLEFEKVSKFTFTLANGIERTENSAVDLLHLSNLSL